MVIVVVLRFIRLNTTGLTLCKDEKSAASHGFIICRVELCTLFSILLARLYCTVFMINTLYTKSLTLIRIIWLFGLVSCVTQFHEVGYNNPCGWQ